MSLARCWRALALAITVAATLTACAEETAAGSAPETAQDVRPDGEIDLDAVDPGEARARRAAAALVGGPGPAVPFRTLNGDVVDLADSYGRRPVYLKIWATWCAPCREQMPHLIETYDRIGSEFTVVAVATGFSETEDDVRAYVEEMALDMPVAIDDGSLAGFLNLRVTPLHVVIDRDGRITYVGHLANAALDAALARAAEPAASSAHGAGRDVVATPVLDALPDRAVTLLDGTELALRDDEDRRATALVFMSPWCEDYLLETQPARSARCRQARELSEALAAEGGARWIGVASGLWVERADAEAYRGGYGVSIPLALDESGDLFRSYDVTAVPAILIFDGAGRAVARFDDATTGLDWAEAVGEALARAAP